jgi:hypothetical protein
MGLYQEQRKNGHKPARLVTVAKLLLPARRGLAEDAGFFR